MNPVACFTLIVTKCSIQTFPKGNVFSEVPSDQKSFMPPSTETAARSEYGHKNKMNINDGKHMPTNKLSQMN